MAISYSNGAAAAKMGSTGLNAYIGTSAILRAYSGTRPTDANTAIGAQVLLAQWTCNATQFGTVSGKTLTASAISAGAGQSGAGTGTNMTWFRLFQSNGTTVVMDGDISGTAGAGDLKFDNVNVANAQTANITGFAITEGN
jgi:hypothetical protein